MEKEKVHKHTNTPLQVPGTAIWKNQRQPFQSLNQSTKDSVSWSKSLIALADPSAREKWVILIDYSIYIPCIRNEEAITRRLVNSCQTESTDAAQADVANMDIEHQNYVEMQGIN